MDRTSRRLCSLENHNKNNSKLRKGMGNRLKYSLNKINQKMMGKIKFKCKVISNKKKRNKNSNSSSNRR